MNKALFTLAVFATLSYGERSVYTDSDFIDGEVIAKRNSREILLLKQKISQQTERIEGLKTILNGQADEISILRNRLKRFEGLEKVVNELSQRVAQIESRPPKVIVKKEIIKVPVVEKEIIRVSDNSTKQNYSRYKEQEQNINMQPKSQAVKVKTQHRQEEPKKVYIKSEDLFRDSVLYFTKKQLTKAEKGFRELVKRNYKPASSHFYLGEISFYRKRYANAIEHYEESAVLDENAAYMDKLLLHAAISLKKLGRVEEANTFFETVIKSYPNSQSARTAKKLLVR